MSNPGPRGKRQTQGRFIAFIVPAGGLESLDLARDAERVEASLEWTRDPERIEGSLDRAQDLELAERQEKGTIG